MRTTARAGACDERGQSTTETMLVMSFLALFIFGAVHLAMFIVTKYMVNLAAFSAARTVLVQSELGVQTGWPAARQVLDGLRWWESGWRNLPEPIRTGERSGRHGLFVGYRVPFGLPLFNDVPAGGTLVVGFSPYVIQDGIEEDGDNAR